MYYNELCYMWNRSEMKSKYRFWKISIYWAKYLYTCENNIRVYRTSCGYLGYKMELDLMIKRWSYEYINFHQNGCFWNISNNDVVDIC